ncbi:TetR/AcrR family transcriptional regulator [Pseudonocardia spinosispora]|uniref:TetR/AcrR family transcriptional regulator n=1 Tax=Pseudonocardia spinosispora TaxID=103441 RepID=UPI000405828A|nr:TetR/AcrR family transcriptional regulator [Pseudonocardia spinosispora]
MAGVRQFDEAAALGRALEVFTSRGFRATSMLDLAAGTGVQRGSLYHAYGGKEEIFLRVFRAYAQRFLDDAAEALARPDTSSALLSFFDYCIGAITRGTPSHGCLSTRTALDASRDAPRIDTAVRELLDGLETVVHDGLTAIKDGRGLTVEPRAAARLVVTTTRGLAVMERAGFDPDQLRDIAATQVSSLVAQPR